MQKPEFKGVASGLNSDKSSNIKDNDSVPVSKPLVEPEKRSYVNKSHKEDAPNFVGLNQNEDVNIFN